jgi:predicted RNA-binding protein
MFKKILLVLIASLVLVNVSLAFQPKLGKWKATGKGKWEDNQVATINFEFCYGCSQDIVCSIYLTKDGTITSFDVNMIIENPNIKANDIFDRKTVISGEFKSDAKATGTLESDVSIRPIDAMKFNVKGTWTAVYVSPNAVSHEGRLATLWGWVKISER